MSYQPTRNTPNELLVTQDDNRQVKAKQAKLTGDFNGNFTLYIAYTKEAKQDPQTWRYCKKAGRKIPVNGFPYYSKADGVREPTPQEVLKRFEDIIRQWTRCRSNYIDHAIIYWNLNRGGRVNYYHQNNKIAFECVENEQILFYDKYGKTNNSSAKMINAPLIHTDNITLQTVNAYYNEIRHGKVGTERAKSIVRYLEHYYGTWEIHQSPLVVETSTDTPEELKAKPQPEAPQEPAQEQEAGKEQESIAQQVSKTLEPYKLPALKKPKHTTVTPEQRKSAYDALAQGKRQAQQKEAFLHQLAHTQTHIAEKLKMYQTAYPADRIDKYFLQEILNSITKENE